MGQRTIFVTPSFSIIHPIYCILNVLVWNLMNSMNGTFCINIYCSHLIVFPRNSL